MKPAVLRTIYCTDSGRPASSRPFARITSDDLPDGIDGVAIRVFPVRRPRSFGYSPALFRALARDMHNFELLTIHSMNLFPQLAAYLQARRTETPYIVTPHGALDPWLAANSRHRKALTNMLWQRRMLGDAAAVHFTTQAEADLAVGVPDEVPRFVVPNGLRTSDFAGLADGGRFRDEYLDSYRGQIVMFLGRIARKKGIDILIAAFARATAGNGARLVIVGPDDEALAEDLRRQAEIEGIGGRVTFLSPLYGRARRDALAAADVWALTSHTENFGNAVVEALAAGRPVLVSNAVNIASDIETAAAGLVTSLEPGEVADALRLLLRDPDLRRGLSERAVAFAQRYDWSAVAPQLAAAYATAAGRPAPHRQRSGTV